MKIEFVEELIKKMTLEEKIGQLNQRGSMKEESRQRDKELLRQGKLGSILNTVDPEEINEYQRIAVEETRLGIPLIIGRDVIHGHRTIFPTPLAESASWDLEQIEEDAKIAAIEANSTGIRWTFAPMVDVSREQRWGRVMEGAGEDSYLGTQIAKARVRGFQTIGEDGYPLLAACAKHYAGYGFSEAGRDYNYTEISDRTMREYVLPPFKACSEEGCATFMSAFNDISGNPASGNKDLINGVLKNEWGFEGFVVSDWASVLELINHGYAADEREAAKRGLIAGVDMDMNSDAYLDNLKSLVESGEISEKQIDESVRRILNVKYWLGLFENPYVDVEKHKALHMCKAHNDISRKAASKSMVLLKNENGILPITSDKFKKVAVMGPNAAETWGMMGNWSDMGRMEEVVTLIDGIRANAPDDIEIGYELGVIYWEKNEVTPKEDFERAIALAKASDLAILCVGEGGELSGENNNRTDIGIPERQQRLIKAVHELGKPMVIVLSNGRAMSIPWEMEIADAVLDIWQSGTQSGNALADVLFGKCNPSGKLTVTFPRNVGQVPIYYNIRKTGRQYTTRYNDCSIWPLIPFGYGLSYSNLVYSDLDLIVNGKSLANDFKTTEILIPVTQMGEYTDFYDTYDGYRASNIEIKEDANFYVEQAISQADTLQVRAKVKNTSDRTTEEIVQLYISDIAATVTRPVKELKGFKKVKLLPNEEREVCFDLGIEELGYYINLNEEKKIEPGQFVAWIGPNSAQALRVRFEIK